MLESKSGRGETRGPLYRTDSSLGLGRTGDYKDEPGGTPVTGLPNSDSLVWTQDEGRDGSRGRNHGPRSVSCVSGVDVVAILPSSETRQGLMGGRDLYTMDSDPPLGRGRRIYVDLVLGPGTYSEKTQNVK